MKVLLLCGLILAAAMYVQGGHEICELSHEQITVMLKCMADHVPAEHKEKALDLVHSQADNIAELVKKQCEAGVDFGEVMKKLLSEEEGAAVRKAYTECHPGHA
ncbi:uncharacterized protein LOC144144004 [Haemaphysalis longicornis]